MADRSCSMPGCGKPYRAKDLCSTHYNVANRPSILIECAACGRTAVKTQHYRSSRRGVCSVECRAYLQFGRTQCRVPDTHPSRSCAVPRDHLSRQQPESAKPRARAWIAGCCTWCGDAYVSAPCTGSPIAYCSDTCGKRAARRRRRAREAGATGFFTWDAFMRLAMALGNCCAYCGEQPADPLEPDHVVPISRGGHNGLGNILPACKSCNGAKRDQLLHEWAADRVRLGLPARRTDVSAYIHLTAHDHSSVAA